MSAVADQHPDLAALKIVGDDETGELENATLLESFGNVPDGFPESLFGLNTQSGVGL